MKRRVGPQLGDVNINSVVSNKSRCEYQKDALLGSPNEHLDSDVLQLQAAADSLRWHNNAKCIKADDYQQATLLNCVDLMPAIGSATRPALGASTQSAVYRTTTISNDVQGSADGKQDKYAERYDFDGNAAVASELVNVANKNCDSLSKLAYNLWLLAKDDHIVIDRKRNEVIRTNAVTNQQTIYRCMDPIHMGMRPATAKDVKCSISKVGRPRKVPALVNEKPASYQKSNQKQSLEPPTLMKSPEVTQRTRYGRVVRSIMPQLGAKLPTALCATTGVTIPVQELQNLVSELKDKDYRCSSINTKPSAKSVPERGTRTVPANAICPGCNKIFLGRRLERHFVKFPEHMPHREAASASASSTEQQSSNNGTLFNLFTAHLQRHADLSEEQRADLFLHELNDFVEQLQLRSTSLIRNTSGLHFVNARIARVLGIPEGQYALDMSAIESAQAPAPEPEPTLLHNNAVAASRNLVDYTGLSMSLDDTLTDEAAQRLNLSAGGKLLPPSEESLLRTVDDLMQPPVAVPANVSGHVVGVSAMLPHYDHASDNAVEALNMKETPNAAILDLNVDFFQFTNNS